MLKYSIFQIGKWSEELVFCEFGFYFLNLIQIIRFLIYPFVLLNY